jgi:uncharacterized protein YjiS (DUF1127 family)
MISKNGSQDVQHLGNEQMANFNTRASVPGSAQISRPFAFPTHAKSTALLIAPAALSLIHNLTVTLRTLRQRERDREELARMSDYELHDIRISSSDRWAEVRKPFWRK